MAFTHGKNAQVALRDVNGVWRDMTSYTSEVTVPGKAGIAETTVFGRGAKTYIGGLLEGTVTMKGYFDPTANAVDNVMAGLLGSQAGLGAGAALGTGLTPVAQVTAQSNYGQFLFLPSGSGAGKVVTIADIVITDYSVSAPVTGVVAYTATFNLSGAPTLAASPNILTSLTSPTGAIVPYGLQVIRGDYADVFAAGSAAGVGWLKANRAPTPPLVNSTGGSGTAVGGATSYLNVIGTVL